jgi:predicted transcriptional regulator
MTSSSTTIRVSTDQRERLRSLAEQRQSSMTEALDAALESLKREQFYREMASAEAALRNDPSGWERYIEERDNWLNADLGK